MKLKRIEAARLARGMVADSLMPPWFPQEVAVLSSGTQKPELLFKTYFTYLCDKKAHLFENGKPEVPPASAVLRNKTKHCC